MNFKTLIKIGFCLILLFVSNAAAAQQPTASLSGEISKFYGEVARNATVTIKLNSKKRRFTRKTTSDDAGKYSFSGIPGGAYQIFVSDSNGLTYEKPSFDVPANKTARLDLKIEYGGDCSNAAEKTLVLSDAEKARIVNEILNVVLLKNDIAESKRLKSQTAGIILSDENVQAKWLKPLKNTKINLLSRTEIVQKAESGSEFMYLLFGEFKVKGNCVVASVSNRWAAPTNSRKTPVSGGGRVFVYGKKGNKLRLKTSGRWEF